MNSDRFSEIWKAVVDNAFYCVGGIDNQGGSDISHEEMKEILQMAKDAIEGVGKKHLRIWWKDGGKRHSGIVIESKYFNHGGSHLQVKVDGSNEIKLVPKEQIDATEWVDDPKKGY